MEHLDQANYNEVPEEKAHTMREELETMHNILEEHMTIKLCMKWKSHNDLWRKESHQVLME